MKTANLEASVEPRVHPRACRTWNRQGNRGPLVSPTINRVDRFLDSLHERPDTRNGTDPVLRPVKSPQRLPHRPAPVRLPAFSLTCHLFVLPREFPLRSYTRRSLYVLSFSLSVCLSVFLRENVEETSDRLSFLFISVFSATAWPTDTVCSSKLLQTRDRLVSRARYRKCGSTRLAISRLAPQFPATMVRDGAGFR